MKYFNKQKILTHLKSEVRADDLYEIGLFMDNNQDAILTVSEKDDTGEMLNVVAFKDLPEFWIEAFEAESKALDFKKWLDEK